MATTFDRIHTSMKQAANESSWTNMDELADTIRQKKLAHFRMKKGGTSIDDYMSQKSIKAILELSRDFGLLREAGGRVSVTDETRSTAGSSEGFSRHLFSLLKTYLDKKNMPLDQLAVYIRKIKLPNVPNPQTIYENIEDPAMSLDLFRKILFLLANVEGIQREVRVFYSE